MKETFNFTLNATLPLFHAFTGCDTVSAFCGRGKTAWNTWKVYPKVIKAFEEFPLIQTETSDMTMETLNDLWCCFMIVRVIS